MRRLLGVALVCLATYGGAQVAADNCSSATGTVVEKIFYPPHPSPSNEVATADPGVVISVTGVGAVFQLKVEGDAYETRAIIEVSKKLWDSISVGDSVPWLDPTLPPCPVAPDDSSNDEG